MLEWPTQALHTLNHLFYILPYKLEDPDQVQSTLIEPLQSLVESVEQHWGELGCQNLFRRDKSIFLPILKKLKTGATTPDRNELIALLAVSNSDAGHTIAALSVNLLRPEWRDAMLNSPVDPHPRKFWKNFQVYQYYPVTHPKLVSIYERHKMGNEIARRLLGYRQIVDIPDLRDLRHAIEAEL